MYIFVVALSPLAGIGERVEACHGYCGIEPCYEIESVLVCRSTHLISTRTGSLALAMQA
jgi:hypothetical protein